VIDLLAVSRDGKEPHPTDLDAVRQNLTLIERITSADPSPDVQPAVDIAVGAALRRCAPLRRVRERQLVGVRQERGVALQGGGRGSAQVCLGVDADHARGLEQRVEQGGDFSAALGLRAVVVFPAHDHIA